MNRLLVRLYPTAWRERYGEEFLDLLEERPVGPFDVADVVLGAIDARLRFGRAPERERRAQGFLMSLRIGGIAALVGAGLAVATLIVGTGLVDIEVEPAVGMAIMTVGLVVMLIALVGLSAFQARSHPRLAWAAFSIPALGLVASLIGAVGLGLKDDDSWWIWFVGVVTFLAGSAVFALVTFRTGALSRRASAVLGVGSVLPFAGFLTPVAGGLAGFEALFQVVGFGVFALGWAALGLEAIRLDRLSPEPHPA